MQAMTRSVLRIIQDLPEVFHFSDHLIKTHAEVQTATPNEGR